MGKPTYDELRSLYDDMEKQKIENEFIVEELYERIVGAITYIERHLIEHYENENYVECKLKEKKELLNILRGIK